jgi:ubiquinone biosynthesis protein Coq4
MPPITLREGLERYYQANPNFVRNQSLKIGIMTVPWCDMLRHDIMHIVTGYSTVLDQELRLIGFLLTALTWRRPWYYYAQSFVVFLEILSLSLRGRAWGKDYYPPLQICRFYWQGVRQGTQVTQKINAYLDPETFLDRTLDSLRHEYGIQNAGSWD